jgi:hypothetical protein
MKEAAMSTATEAFRRIMRGYEKGIYTRLEVVCQLVELGAICPPAEVSLDLPAEWLTQIREATTTPPPTIDDVQYISGALLQEGVDAEQHYAQLCKAWFAGAWNWHRHFGGSGSDVSALKV